LDYYERSLQLYEELGLKKGMSISLKNIGDIYKDQGKLKEALQYLNKSMTIAQALSAPDRIRDAAGVLKEIYKTQNEGMKAMEMFELEIQMRDSIQSEEAKKGLIKMELEHEYVKKELIAEQEHQKEIYEKNKTRNYLAGGGLLALIMAGGVLTRLRYVRKAKSIVEKEKDRSESLLLNILPYEVAEELKEKGHSDATLIDEVTVIFTDFKGFTAMSEQVTPKELVADLHACFSEFDHICEKYGIEKIKTIGDSYMAAGGLPTINQTHATDVVKAALEMAAVVENGKAEKIAQNLPYFEMRLGAHTGPVVAGIVGVKKFQYDIWGDTVNIASRMESSGEVGKVNISQFTYELIKDNSDFTFESRGKLEAKGKGEIEMYFVSKA
jgi:adenylate cyclase